MEDESFSGTPELVAHLVLAFPEKNPGLLGDSAAFPEPHMFLPSSEFELWFGQLEEEVSSTLGRKLAHAVTEAEEHRLRTMRAELPNPIFGKRKKQLNFLNSHLNLRSHGMMEQMRGDGQLEFLVRDRCFGPIAAGIASASAEFLNRRRFRMRWSDDGGTQTKVTLEPDQRDIPPATKVDARWNDAFSNPIGGEHPLSLAVKEGDGRWSIDGVKILSISRDTIVRLEESILPFASTIEDVPTQFEWVGVKDDDRKVVWSAMAEASRKRFEANEDLVLVAEDDHWIHVGHRFLGRAGLGAVTKANSNGQHGAVEITLPTVFHPAIVAGTMAGAWERVEGRPAKCEWVNSAKGHTLSLAPLHEL